MRYCLLITLFFSNISIEAQNQGNIWIFGNKTGLDFNNGLPVPFFTSEMIAAEGSASISDKNGTLLFYTNGTTVWNRNNVVMQNGDALMNSFGGAQTAVTVQLPNSDYLYYIFSVDKSGGINGFRYSIVDIRLDNGLGGVTQKNIPILTPVCEKVTATVSCNGRDVWIVTHKFNSYDYYSYLLTPLGLNNTPVISTSPNYVGNGSCNASGYLKVSANGKKIVSCNACSIDYLELADFNKGTGILSNFKELSAKPYYGAESFSGTYGAEFSLNSKYLYVTSSYSDGDDTSYLYQFDASLLTQNQIQNSRFLINQFTTNGGYYNGALQIAPDKKIYLTHYGNNYLSVINNPEVQGAACNFSFRTINVNNGDPLFHYATAGLPTFVQSYFRNPIITIGNCFFQNITFSISDITDVDSVKWNFGDPITGIQNVSISYNPTHLFSTQNPFRVKLTLFFNTGCVDSVYKDISPGPLRLFIGNDTSFCKNDTLILKSNISNASYLWSNGSVGSVIKVTNGGTYWVKVKLGECEAYDDIIVTVANLPQFTLGNDQLICNNISTTLTPSPTYANATYTWSNNTATPTTTVTTAGDYWLLLKDAKGCTWRDTVKVNYKQLPNYTLGADKAICEKDTLTLDATVAGATSYTWKNGAITPTIKAYTTGTYWCDVNKDGCIYRDSIDILVKPLPQVNLGKDTTICEDNTYTLNATNTNSTYKWQDGATTATYTVSQVGQYHVTVTKLGCITKDTINISYQLKPQFDLGIDQLICPNFTITLQPKFLSTDTLPLQYQWQDGSSNPSYTATQQGIYFVDISNYCGDTRDQIIISKGLCKIYVPTIFTPNNDQKNDVFKIEGGEAIKDFQLTIYNRWGTKIFETKNITQGWNGTINSKPQPAGAYIYFIQYKDALTNKPAMMKGTVMLVR
jgi:gliding motility-associated-like protein